MAGKTYRLIEQTSPSIDSLDRDKSIVLVNISPIEGHGPHLPLGVDFLNGEYFVDSIARLINQKIPAFDVVIVPGFPIGSQVYRFPGSLWISNSTLFSLACGLGESLAQFGFRRIFMISGHGAPKDIVAIDTACKKISRKFDIHMSNLSGSMAVKFLDGEFADRISKKLSKPLSVQDLDILKKDFHGGWWETSMMLLLHPALVSETYKNLQTKEKTPETKREKPGYFGSPAMATVEFARASLEVMTEEAITAIEKCLSNKPPGAVLVSPLYRMIVLRPYFRRNLVIAVSLALIILAGLIFML